MPPAAPSRSTPRWRRQPDARPQQILDAAFRVFGTQGLHRATLDDVARAAGITKGTIYLYFPGKAALFSAMLKSRVTALLPDVESAAAGDPAALPAQITGLGGRLYRFFRSPAYLGLWRTLVGEAAQFPEVAAAVFREGILPANRRLAGLIQRGIEAGVFRPVDPLIAGRSFAAMFQIFAVTQKLMGGERVHRLNDREVVKTVTSIFLQGMLAESSAERRAPSAEGRVARAASREPRAAKRGAGKAGGRPGGTGPARRRQAVRVAERG